MDHGIQVKVNPQMVHFHSYGNSSHPLWSHFQKNRCSLKSLTDFSCYGENVVYAAALPTHTYTCLMWLKKNMIITIDDLARRRKSIFVPTADANMDKGAIYDYTFDAPKLKNLLKSQRTG